MRMRSLCDGVAIIVLAGFLSACTEYYENRIDRLYTECDSRDLPPEAVNSCLERVARVQAAHPSPRLVALQRQLERQSEVADTYRGKDAEETVGANADGENSPDGYGEGDQGGSDIGEMLASPDSDVGPGLGEDFSGYEDSLEPGPDRMPPSEPQEPMDPDE